jgi:hypothetical protein
MLCYAENNMMVDQSSWRENSLMHQHALLSLPPSLIFFRKTNAFDTQTSASGSVSIMKKHTIQQNRLRYLQRLPTRMYYRPTSISLPLEEA